MARGEGETKGKSDVLVWLQVVSGALAILTFLGIADYHRLAVLIGWEKSHTAPPALPSPSPLVPSISSDTGPNDPQDAATCTSALSDIHALEFDIPTYSYTAISQFYGDKSSTFSSLAGAATNLTLKLYLVGIQDVTLKLDVDYLLEARSSPAQPAPDLAELNSYESKVKSFCSQEAGIAG